MNVAQSPLPRSWTRAHSRVSSTMLVNTVTPFSRRKVSTTVQQMPEKSSKWMIQDSHHRNHTPTEFFCAAGDYRAESWLENHKLPLYSSQISLPRLPVPSLEETMATFLPTALPLVETDTQAQSLQAACRAFPQQAATLQQRLLDRAASTQNSSWLQHWWNEQGYLKPRDPNCIGVSYFFRLTDDPAVPCSPAGNLERAAAVLQATLEYALPIQSGTKAADTLGRKQPVMPLCSTQYKYLFGACRIPTPGQDVVRVYRPGKAQHCAVACRGQFFKLPLTDAQGQALPQATLLELLRQCVADSNAAAATAATTNVPQIGWLTSSPRDAWADTYHNLLLSNDSLQVSLETLQSALVVLCLDDGENDESLVPAQPMSDRDMALLLWHGNVKHSANRWFDKSIQLVMKQGRLGLIGEHSMADGMPAVGFCDHLVKRSAELLREKQMPRHGDESVSAVTHNSDTNVSNIFADSLENLEQDQQGELIRRVDEARQYMTDRIHSFDLQVLGYQGYGSSLIKQMGYSPDGFVQMAMQVAGFRMFGKQVGTYESIQTRVFLHGRTETARSVSLSSAAFCEAMGSTRKWTISEDEKARKRSLLGEAVDGHSRYCRKASEGLGVDRHLFGLSMLVQEGDMTPDLFSHPLFHRSKRWLMSTSTLPNTAPGFGPVDEEGVGIGYDLGPESCFFTLTSKKDNEFVNTMTDLISEAMDELKLLAQDDGLPTSRL